MFDRNLKLNLFILLLSNVVFWSGTKKFFFNSKNRKLKKFFNSQVLKFREKNLEKQFK